MPSVEKATAEMFRQTDATLSAGLTEYARAASSAATPTVKSLQAALTQARSARASAPRCMVVDLTSSYIRCARCQSAAVEDL